MHDVVNFLITGTSRGLGLELVKISLSAGNRVFAICRNLSVNVKLQTLMNEYDKSLFVFEGDVSDSVQLHNILEKVKEKTDHIDVIINNAAILLKNESVFTLDKTQMLKLFEINAIAPLEMIRLFFDLLEASKNPKVLNISSESGVINRVKTFNGLYSYKASKAALNMMTRLMALELREKKIVVVAVDPGWIKTDMGGPKATGDPSVSASGIIKISQNLTIEESGCFLDYDGTVLKY